MKKDEVPQDKSNLESANIKDMYYAVDENGEYTTELSTGWAPKTIALDNAIQDIEERAAMAKTRVLNNELSPIAYYMELHKMDLGILASYVGFWKWRVKRHFKPTVFKKLTLKTLQKYADAFDITIEELKKVDP
ncbi:helix-turn-helix domain-containing protein [uncultured Kriegella sp.]|uniref:helix-turn-helix domain-containing protein n=1 Tax=uncultured Kriegella sp. TaxID=1798910 RepID=UPI0030D84D3E|tara:strand:+ start:77466 stop:77867 length:402 start_codon:yes stop_codon:yes gene_type:complete